MVEIVSRAAWGARAPKSTPKKIAIPSKELWLHHSVSPSGFAARIRAIQNYHMDSKGWNDIAYSFLINHAGDIYEGRGPGVSGAHTAGHNTISHAICLLGNFNSVQPTAAALDSLKALIGHGFESGWWPQTLTGGHRDTRGSLPKDCPGDNLYKLIPAINQELVEDDMPSIEEIEALIDKKTPSIATASRDAILYDQWSANASIKQAIGRTYERSFLFLDTVSDAELDAAVDELIATLPQKTLDLLKQKL